MTEMAQTTAGTKTVQERPANALPAWKVILKMVRYRWKLWTLNLASMLVLTAFWQLPAIVMRAFFS